jgi:NADPH:quinone reductase-like Zn-dependent oxidoreductase
MKAIMITKYGQPSVVLQVSELAKPVPADYQALIRVRACSLNVGDLAAIKGVLLARLLGTGWRKPKRALLGTDLAGTVEAVGKNVTRFKPGDEVFGAAPGSFAEYVCAAENRLALKPAGVTFEEAAAVPVGGVTALQGLRKGMVQPGQRVLVHGASGTVGTFTVQLAKALGAEVTALCSTRNLANAHLLGADHIIDYTQEDFTKNGERYDLILAVNGKRSVFAYRNALTPKGTCVVLGGSISQIFQAILWGKLFPKAGARTIGFMGIAKMNQDDLDHLKELLAVGKIKPLIEKCYPLSQTAQAAGYLLEGHARAKLVIIVDVADQFQQDPG